MGMKIAVIILSVLVVGLLVDRVAFMGKSSVLDARLDRMAEDSELIMGELNLRDYDGRVRDSLMMLEIGKSEDRLEHWMVLRTESWTKAEVYRDSVNMLRKERDSLTRTFMEW